MDSEDIKKDNKKNTDKFKNEPKIEKVGGIKGWLLRKAKTFMFDVKNNKLVLPQGVTLTVEEKAELEAMFGQIIDQAEVVAKHREQVMSAQQQMGVRFKSNVVKGYSLLVNGTYRELTGVLAHKIHDNLSQMLSVGNLRGLWKVLNKSNDNNKLAEKTAVNSMQKVRERETR